MTLQSTPRYLYMEKNMIQKDTLIHTHTHTHTHTHNGILLSHKKE